MAGTRMTPRKHAEKSFNDWSRNSNHESTVEAPESLAVLSELPFGLLQVDHLRSNTCIGDTGFCSAGSQELQVECPDLVV